MNFKLPQILFTSVPHQTPHKPITMVLGLLTIAAIPTTIAVAEGISEQRKKNDEKDDEARTAKFYLDVYCEAKSRRTKEIHGKRCVLRNDKVR
jgi:hypothetical protein